MTSRTDPTLQQAAAATAACLQGHWSAHTRLDALPAALQPPDVAAAYAAQAALAARRQDALRGWKIAATSAAGQRHINVSGPLAGRLFGARVLRSGDQVPLVAGGMAVAEAEFTLVLAHPLPEQDPPWNEAQILACLGAVHPGIESPDSRFRNFVEVGESALIADNACADWFVLGSEAPAAWRTLDLAAHTVQAWRNGEPVALGQGARVLGGPLCAAAWFANALRAQGLRWQPGEILATGTCLTPVPVRPGDQVRMDFGVLGSVEARFCDAGTPT